MPVKDYTAFPLCETYLTEQKVGDYVLTPKRAVPCSKGLEWWIRWYPSGQTEANNGHVSVFLWVNMPVEATVTFAVDDSSIIQTFTYEFADSPDSYGFIDFASHEELRPLFLDGKLTIRCTAEFTCSIRSIHVAPAFYRMLEYSPPDFDLVVGQNRIQVHKNFISLISPVYFAMLQNKSICESGNCGYRF